MCATGATTLASNEARDMESPRTLCEPTAHKMRALSRCVLGRAVGVTRLARRDVIGSGDRLVCRVVDVKPRQDLAMAVTGICAGPLRHGPAAIGTRFDRPDVSRILAHWC